MSSLECARVSIGEERDHMEGKGGGRQRLRYIDGDVPRCMRHNDDKSKSKLNRTPQRRRRAAAMKQKKRKLEKAAAKR